MTSDRGRLAFAAAATIMLVATVIVVALSGSSDDEGAAVDEECLAAWNGDSLALSDGVHAYTGHGYRATLVTRVDSEGGITEAGGRCAVVFAAAQVDREPDFGVRVQDDDRWSGLALADRVPLDEIVAMQRDATATANTTLLPDGRLTPSG